MIAARISAKTMRKSTAFLRFSFAVNTNITASNTRLTDAVFTEEGGIIVRSPSILWRIHMKGKGN